MKTVKPTLAEIVQKIITSFKNDELPKDKVALAFFTAIKNWIDGEPNSHERRVIFQKIITGYKKYCIKKDAIGAQNEIGKAIHEIQPIWEQHENTITFNPSPVLKKVKNVIRHFVRPSEKTIGELWYNQF